jgi:hypothetical protein
MMSLTSSAYAASVTYIYTGNPFTVFSNPTTYTESNFVTVRLELEELLGADLISSSITPVTFEISDGLNILTESNTAVSEFIFFTDNEGIITDSQIFALSSVAIPTDIGDRVITIESYSGSVDRGMIDTCIEIQSSRCVRSFDVGETAFSNTGSWAITATPPSPVPLPAAIWLFVMGLLGLIGLARSNS